jgi:hydroxymethylbilane synthase
MSRTSRQNVEDMVNTHLRLGTRASALALSQSEQVAARLRALGFEVELVRIRTEGDRIRGSLARIGGTGVFVTALREALLDGDCDVAVHSLKDLPTAPAAGIALAAVPEREDPRDVLCARDGLTLETLPQGARLGTGSPRRAAQLRLVRPDLEVVDIRGNVDTRLGRVAGGPDGLDGVVLARAGLVRLGRLDAVTQVLEPDIVTPAPGQGALAVECRAEDDGASAEDGRGDPSSADRVASPPGRAVAEPRDILRRVRALDHLPTRLEVVAERAVLAGLEAGCTAPVGALGRMSREGTMTLAAVAVAPEGRPFRAAFTEPVTTPASAHALGVRLADELLAAGLPAAAPRGGAVLPSEPVSAPPIARDADA